LLSQSGFVSFTGFDILTIHAKVLPPFQLHSRSPCPRWWEMDDDQGRREIFQFSSQALHSFIM